MATPAPSDAALEARAAALMQGDVAKLRGAPTVPAETYVNEATLKAARDIAALPTRELRAQGLADLKRDLGNDAVGREAFASVLVAGQAPFPEQGLAERATRLRDAFADNVSNGSITTQDAAAIIRQQAQSTVPNAARIGSYFDHLHKGTPDQPDTRSEEMRTTVADESRRAARGVENSHPEVAGQLYAQTANVMADMNPADRERTLATMQRERPDGIQRFAAGATGGMADRLTLADDERMSGATDLPFRTNGLAAVMNDTNDRVAAAQRRGRTDAVAGRESAQLFDGTTQYLGAAIGTPADRALGAHDETTGLRNALNRTVEADAPMLLRENMVRNGTELSTQGVNAFSSYARFQFDAPDTPHGVETVTRAQGALGGLVGRLESDVMSADRDGGARLGKEFGAAFAPSIDGAKNTAWVSGQLIGTSQLGIQEGFQVRLARGDAEQDAARGMFERTSGIAEAAAKIATVGGQEEISGLAEGLKAIADKAKDAVPKPELYQSSEANALIALRDAYRDRLGTTNHGFNQLFSVGYSDSTGDRLNDNEQTADASAIRAASDSRENPLSKVLGNTVVPQGDSLAQPQAPIHSR